jgi:Flp pilus assembly protein TadB
MTGNSYTLEMDSVRFGRALGIGARAAAKTLVTAVDAATAPNPSAPAKTTSTTAHPKEASTEAQPAEKKAKASGVRLGQQAVRTTAQVKQTGKGLKQGSKRFGEAMWGPFVKLSGVLWLEVTGVFFGIFAVFALGGTWKMAMNHDAPSHLIGTAAMAVLFGYFCVSSFVRASRRGRRR